MHGSLIAYRHKTTHTLYMVACTHRVAQTNRFLHWLFNRIGMCTCRCQNMQPSIHMHVNARCWNIIQSVASGELIVTIDQCSMIIMTRGNRWNTIVRLYGWSCVAMNDNWLVCIWLCHDMESASWASHRHLVGNDGRTLKHMKLVTRATKQHRTSQSMTWMHFVLRSLMSYT